MGVQWLWIHTRTINYHYLQVEKLGAANDQDLGPLYERFGYKSFLVGRLALRLLIAGIANNCSWKWPRRGNSVNQVIKANPPDY